MKRLHIQIQLFVVLSMLYYSPKAGAQHIDQHFNPNSGGSIYLRMMDTMMERMADAGSGSTAAIYFTAEMIPHHEGAIAMANYEIKYGGDFEMVQLAKSIVAEQTIEIQQMHLWLQFGDSNTTIPAGFEQAMDNTMSKMMKDMPSVEKLTAIDKAFAMVMKPHHQAAIDMAKVILVYSTNTQTTAFAKHIISSQQIEIEQMQLFLSK